MVEQLSTKHDFVTKTKGQCFLCSKNTSLQYSSTRTESSPIYSLHCLASYLKLDMEKVFTGNEPIPAHLVERVKMSRLKAELCGECAVLNKRFSNIFRQLEKMEMEASSCLELIQQKLERAAQFDKAPNDQWHSKLEISEALRKDAMQKCSRKLGNILPLARIERLTKQKITAQNGKIKAAYAAVGDQHSVINPEDEEWEDTGSPVSISVPDEYDETDLDQIPVLGVETEGKKMTEGMSVSDKLDMITKFKVEDGSDRDNSSSALAGGSKRRRMTKHNNIQKNQLSQAIPPPIRVSGGVGLGMTAKPKTSKTSDTGKFKCPICSKEYANLSSFKQHYESAHLKTRYACETCKKDFPQKKNYERHYLSIHMGVRFKCGKCNKTFAQEKDLKKHQKICH